MSASDNRSRHTYHRSYGRKRKPVLDLNAPPLPFPPGNNWEQVGPSNLDQPQDAEINQGTAPVQPAPIDVEALDDDVVISSPRAFAEARKYSRRNQAQPVVVDVESEERSTRVYKTNQYRRRRMEPTQKSAINPDILINLEAATPKVSTAPPPPPKELTFNCPVCIGPLVEEMSTKCGHIFCKACIKTAISTQNKCPTCRRRVTMKDIIRVYLPSAS